jgi:hypothetical protein
MGGWEGTALATIRPQPAMMANHGCRAPRRVFEGVGAQALLMAAVPVSLAWLGWRVRGVRRWPVPGCLVLRRTAVLRGAPARRRATWLLAAAAATGALVAGVVCVLLALIADIGQRWNC